jgi:hypothetical protein
MVRIVNDAAHSSENRSPDRYWKQAREEYDALKKFRTEHKPSMQISMLTNQQGAPGAL